MLGAHDLCHPDIALPVAEGEVRKRPPEMTTWAVYDWDPSLPGTVTGLTATSEPVRYARRLEDYL